jgi:asparagine synthetase B (glutamine-hydrolysing)
LGKRDFKYENFSISDIENLLKESINLRLVSDVDVGIFFSGGIDSTLVASLVDQKLDLFFMEFEGKENQNVEKISKITNAIPIIGFGCSDCNCISHLYYFENSDFLNSLPDGLIEFRTLLKSL